ncbi:hypothetical protein [Agromyces bauzanensis]|uniref:Uncharacterized protein n=1 Tax=Agromyces bauzanensis TaxID=1308924 RepID=A0A917PIX5_9MICO|nr:hypothetical protein [Agromyces bauzanensis]GGJ81069.1 hypothetical protein GCM10011372_19310 [Agromyces bauzanensis]
MNPATPHRASLTVLVGLAAVGVIAGLLAGSPMLEQLMPRLPAVPTTNLAVGFAAVGLVVVAIWGVVGLGRAARTRARRNALASTVRGELSCGIRNRLLVRRLNELLDDAGGVRLGARFSVVVDELGVAFWNGGGRPHGAAHFPWREVRNIRADSMVVGGSVEHVLVLRVRHNGSSIELPIILSAGRFGRYAMSDAPFFAVVRSWKAKHRAALAAEGLELPPLTAPIPVIRPEVAAAARR